MFCFFDEKVSYYSIELIKGETQKETSDNVGCRGWAWAERVDPIECKIIIEGVNLRSAPVKVKDNIVCKAKKGSKIKILDKKIIWYHTPEGWMFHTRVKKDN